MYAALEVSGASVERFIKGGFNVIRFFLIKYIRVIGLSVFIAVSPVLINEFNNNERVSIIKYTIF